ncbi:hypothetical protein [Marinobacter sp. OP 3.4]|uniref:hypothetical protein n=1 Tax=Marinobacter sp. OP 3.4 TaxID=3076501 RepID=UPI002E1D49DD
MSIKYLLLSCVLVMTSTVASASEDYFEEWCDTFTAQGMVSLAANRIYGRTSTLSDSEYEARSQWVNAAYKRAEERFTKLTGQEFQGYEFESGREDWVSRCQLADQIQ